MAMGSSDYVACYGSNSCYVILVAEHPGVVHLLAGAAALLLEVSPSLTPMQLVLC